MNSFSSAEPKRLGETVSSAASMTLFLIFAVCCLIIISVAAAAYGRISRNYENTFDSAAAVRYITNRMRACGGAEIISENELLLRDSGYSTLIYHSGGAVYERLFPEGDTPVSSGGERLFGAEQLIIEEDGGLIRITVRDGGDVFTAFCKG